MKISILFVSILAIILHTSQAKKSTMVRGTLFDYLSKLNGFVSRDIAYGTSRLVKDRLGGLGDSAVDFTSCPGPHEEIYDIDDDYSHTEPDLAKKNINITLILEGVMTEDVHVDQLHLDVYWNGNLFHTEDHKLDKDVEEQEPYEMEFTWFVPGFAPSGGYIVDLVLKSAGQELG